ncbi:MAG TPA: S8 family serine peptidase [Solirubrobacteraceae bacterium]|nr:S8 family serine peptidase [Solirubrobacteraceae bacterium]
MTRLCLALIAAGLCAATGPAAAGASTADEIVVKREAGLTAGERADVRADAGVALTRTLPLDDVEVVAARPGDRAAALADLRADPDVVWAEPNRERHALAQDFYWPRLWGLENSGQSVHGVAGTADADIDAPDAWTLTRGRDVVVGVVDTGVQAGHQDLVTVPGWDFVDDDATPSDGHGHGTHVAGTIAAPQNSLGVVGVAPRARVMPIRVLDDTGTGSAADSAAGFAYAGERGLKVVNGSIGSTDFSLAEMEAIRDHPGTLYVLAAGNDGSNNDVYGSYPCAYNLPNIVCVGASDQDDQPAEFSNYGASTVDIFAPGVNIISTYKGGAFAYMDGTSMAAPHAAGVAALLAARDPSLGPAQLKQAIMDSVDPVGALAGRSVTGGRLNAAGALAELPPDTTPPAVPTGLTATGGDRQIGLTWTPSSEEDVAGYRVYPALGSPTLDPLATPVAAAWTAGGLGVDEQHSYRVSAVDRAGNESALSAPVGARTAAPAAPAASDPAPAGGSAAAPAAVAPPPVTRPSQRPAATLAGARVSGRVVVCAHGCRARSATLRFTLGAPASVGVVVARRACANGRCRYRTAGTRTLRLAGGRQRLTIGAKLAGVKLRAGSWRVTLTTPAARTTARFSVRAR